MSIKEDLMAVAATGSQRGSQELAGSMQMLQLLTQAGLVENQKTRLTVQGRGGEVQRARGWRQRERRGNSMDSGRAEGSGGSKWWRLWPLCRFGESRRLCD